MKYKTVALTAKQAAMWDKTRCTLLWQANAFTHIFYTMLDNSGTKDVAFFTQEVPIAATDGVNLLLNPDTFFNYTLSEQVFICCHEIMHCILGHCERAYSYQRTGKITYPDGSTLPYSAELANIAQDLVINDILIDSKLGTFNKQWLHDKQYGDAQTTWVDCYKKIYKAAKDKGGGGGGGGGDGGQGPNGQGFDKILQPGASQGKDPRSAAGQRNEQQWGQAVAAAVASAKAQGKLPAGLARFFEEVLEPKVEWQEHIRALIARRLGSDTYDWRRPDRRFISRRDPIYMPARSGFGAGTVVVGCDTSGSIGAKELDMFFAEMAGILADVRPRELVIMWCDAKVHRVDYCDEVGDLNTLRCKGAPGGGSTSFVPVFDQIENEGIEPDALVYLTDGMGTFPARAPSYPVIWGNIYPASKYPFGDVVEVPKQA